MLPLVQDVTTGTECYHWYTYRIFLLLPFGGYCSSLLCLSFQPSVSPGRPGHSFAPSYWSRRSEHWPPDWSGGCVWCQRGAGLHSSLRHVVSVLISNNMIQFVKYYYTVITELKRSYKNNFLLISTGFLVSKQMNYYGALLKKVTQVAINVKKWKYRKRLTFFDIFKYE